MADSPDTMKKYSVIFDDMDRHYECLTNTLPGIVYTLDEKGHFTFLSSAVESSTGFTRNNLLGRHFSAIVHPDELRNVSRDYILPRFEGVSTGGDRAPKLFDERRSWPRRTDGLQVKIRSANGNAENGDRLLSCKVNASGQYDGNNRFCGTVGVLYDIVADDMPFFLTGRNHNYSAFEMLTSALSHVFSNIFTGIYGNLQLIEMQLERPNDYRSNIDAIKHSVEKAVSLIRKLSENVTGAHSSGGILFKKILVDTADELLKQAGVEYLCDNGTDLWPAELHPDYLRHILRAILYHINRTAGRDAPVQISMANIREAPQRLPRIDCAYISARFEFIPNQLPPPVCPEEAEFSSLESVASMAVSYELLKKTGGLLSTSNSSTGCVVQLFLPARNTEMHS
jgi:PAS domain S-box-containing protein